ncbi:hypothetical protein BDZ97DRAFT_1762705 [Flammula alnicola]|nr:hypothetical protein BDZ97DRAFT_1762705 [Flammula alnicola]
MSLFSPPPNPADLRPLLRPLVLAHLFNWLLAGILSVQVYVYHLSFPNDSTRIKTLVYCVYFMHMLQLGFTAKTAVRALADGFGNFTILNEIGTIWVDVSIMISLPAFISQMLYVHRIRILSGSKLLARVIVLLAMFQLAMGIVNTVPSRGSPMEALVTDIFTPRVILVNTIQNSANALCDIMIAITMTYYLSRGQSGIRQTRTLLNKLIRLIIATIVTIINLVLLIVASGHSYYFITTGGVLGQLYTNSILALLNSRSRSEVALDETLQLELSSVSFNIH